MDWKERRTNVRLPAELPMRSALVGSDTSMTLVDVSEGGFAVASDQPLPFLSHLEFAFETPDGAWRATFAARAAYCLTQPRPDGPHEGKYLAGFSFRHSTSPDVRSRILELIDNVVVNITA